MVIDQEKYAHYVLGELLMLRAKVIVLESTVQTLVLACRPEYYDEYVKSLESVFEQTARALLADHPFLKNDFDALMSQLSPGD